MTADHQRTTRLWWERQPEYEIYISRIVLREAGAGDLEAARSRLALVEKLPRLVATPECYALARSFLQELVLPRKVVYDALHLAIAAVHEMNYLLTWNCTHIANATLREPIASVCRANGYEPPTICTPDELLAEEGE